MKKYAKIGNSKQKQAKFIEFLGNVRRIVETFQTPPPFYGISDLSVCFTASSPTSGEPISGEA